MQEERTVYTYIHDRMILTLRSASRRIVESQSFHSSFRFYCASLRRMADIPVYEKHYINGQWVGTLSKKKEFIDVFDSSQGTTYCKGKVSFSDLVNIVQHQTIIDSCSWV